MKNFQYAALTEFNKIMESAVEEQLEKAKLYAKKGRYEIPFSNLYKYQSFDYDMFYDMLEEREEVSGVKVDNDMKSCELRSLQNSFMPKRVKKQKKYLKINSSWRMQNIYYGWKAVRENARTFPTV